MPAAPEQLQSSIARFVQFKEEGRTSQLQSIETQFRHMAQGGDGSAASEGEIRKTYYPEWSTRDFQTVCCVMGWEYEGARLYNIFSDYQ